MKLNILNKKETEKILGHLKDQFGFDSKLYYVFLLSEKNRIYIINKDLEKIDTSKLRVNNYGLYIGELKDKKVRLGIEGSQLIGPKATKNILELDDKEAKDWLKGFDITPKTDLKDYAIIKHKDDFLGCAKIAADKILNFVPKTRRIKSSD